MHIVIAGNGILGLTTAFRLVRALGAGDRVTLVGKRSRPGSATLAAAAMLNSFAEVEAGALESDLELYRFELSRRATRLWPDFAAEVFGAAGAADSAFAGGAGTLGSGTYVVDNGARREGDVNFDAIVQALERFDEPHELVSPDDIPNYRPALSHQAARALYLPREGWMSPRPFVVALDTALTADPRVRFVDGAVAKLERKGSAVGAAVLEDGGRIEGDQFLLATGATSGDVLRASDLGIFVQRIFYGVGVSIEIRSAEYRHTKCVRTPRRGLDGGIYTAPYFPSLEAGVSPEAGDAHVIVGASNHVLAKPESFARLAAVEWLARSAADEIQRGFSSAELVRVNVGWRPTSQDTFPLVGRTSIPNLVVATGTKRDGFHLSPLLSDYVAAIVLHRPVDARFAVFAPERAPLRALTRETAIARAVRHHASAAEAEEKYRADVERLHDAVGADAWGIPPEMLDLYRRGDAVADGSYPQTKG